MTLRSLPRNADREGASRNKRAASPSDAGACTQPDETLRRRLSSGRGGGGSTALLAVTHSVRAGRASEEDVFTCSIRRSATTWCCTSRDGPRRIPGVVATACRDVGSQCVAPEPLDYSSNVPQTPQKYEKICIRSICAVQCL